MSEETARAFREAGAERLSREELRERYRELREKVDLSPETVAELGGFTLDSERD